MGIIAEAGSPFADRLLRRFDQVAADPAASQLTVLQGLLRQWAPAQ